MGGRISFTAEGATLKQLRQLMKHYGHPSTVIQVAIKHLYREQFPDSSTLCSRLNRTATGLVTLARISPLAALESAAAVFALDKITDNESRRIYQTENGRLVNLRTAGTEIDENGLGFDDNTDWSES